AVFRRLVEAAHAVAVGLLPPDVSSARPAAAAAPEPGAPYEHPVYGAGVVVKRSIQLVDRRRAWVLDVRFADGTVRSVVGERVS
ncbi:MAG: hypothetical protein KGL53_03095, partial [Elusimicrobia bacterium]|nr:hypothetical protein [Elusimicrobiota bacterium]